MTKEEALHKLEFMRNAYQQLIDENVDEGRFVGTDVTGTWKADTPLNEVYREHVEALDMAISAMKKQEDDEKPTIHFWALMVITLACVNVIGLTQDIYFRIQRQIGIGLIRNSQKLLLGGSCQIYTSRKNNE